MKKVLFIILFHASFLLNAQVNLVPNYSFEQKIKCPIGPTTDFITGYAANWTGLSGACGPLGWYSGECWSSGDVGVPGNEWGYQNARTGLSYAGILSYVSPYDLVCPFGDTRTYLENLLINPLKSNVSYCVTFYVNLGDTCSWACNDMGAYFSDSALYNDPNGTAKSYLTPQIANDPFNNPLTDKINWTSISGSFNANGGEKYIVIGNFKDDWNSSVDSLNKPTGTTFQAAYYFVDDVFVRQIVMAHAGKDTFICKGAQVLIGKDSALPGVRYQWQPTTGLTNPNAAQTLASPGVSTTYTLTVFNDSNKGCNCPDSVNSSTVTINVDNFTITACCAVTTTQWQAVSLSASSAKNYVWFPSTGLNCDTCKMVSANPQSTTLYYLTETDSMGCRLTDSVLVTVENPNDIFIPNAFSPNNDGQNDILLAKGSGVGTFHMIIYDRWGNKVFESYNFNIGWDGTYKNKPEDAGTYVYYVNGTYADGSSFIKKGNVILVR